VAAVRSRSGFLATTITEFIRLMAWNFTILWLSPPSPASSSVSSSVMSGSGALLRRG